jgi:putative chitinase
MIDLTLYKKELDVVFNRYHINSSLAQAMFLAQIDHESNSLQNMVENLNYTPEALIKIFSRRRISIVDAHKYGRTQGRRADQEAIANRIYGGSWGLENLGNIEVGDGWKYRGRGPIQCTGRNNYTAYAKYSGVGAVEHPELLSEIAIGLDFAGYFWKQHNLTELAEKSAIVKITKAINGGTLGLKERIYLFNRYKLILNV